MFDIWKPVEGLVLAVNARNEISAERWPRKFVCITLYLSATSIKNLTLQYIDVSIKAGNLHGWFTETLTEFRS